MILCRKRGTKKVVVLIGLVCSALVFYKLVSDLEPPSENFRLLKEGYLKLTPIPFRLPGKSRDLHRDDRSVRYCNLPNKPANGSEGIIPEGYRLRMVHVFIRHGDRTSIETIPNIQQPTFQCNLSNWYSDIWGDNKYKAFAQHMERQNTDGINSGLKRYSLYPNIYKCPPGGLTNIGALQHIILGEFLHKQYIEKNSLLNSRIQSNLQVSVRSTSVGRTYQSALAFLYGFIPELTVSEMDLTDSYGLYMCVPSIHQFCRCNLIKRLQEKLLTNVVENNTSRHDAIVNKIAHSLQLERDSIRSIGTVIDTILPPFCHNSTYACSSDKNTRACLDQYRDDLWDEYIESKRLFIHSPDKSYLKFSFLQLYPVLNEISNVIESNSDVKIDRTFNLYSGHDKTVSALLMVLGMYDGTWPPYASRFVIEVIESEQQQSKQHKQFLRFIYNGNDVTNDVRFCKHKSHPTLCDFDLYKQYIANQLVDLFGKSNYIEVCKSKG